MYHDDDDLHMCINCHATIVGLENYISHRNADPCKQQHPVKENETPIPVLPPLGIPKSEHIRSVPSAQTPSSGDHLNFLNADFFFSSLELQSRRKDAVFEEVMGIEEVLEEEFEDREGPEMVHASGGKWGYEDYVQERDVWGGMDEKGKEMGEVERGGGEAGMDGGGIACKGEGRKGGIKSIGVGEEREIGGKRRLRASSEMEENNSDYVGGLGSGGHFSIIETSAKCDLTPRTSILTNSQSQDLDVPGTTEAAKVGGVGEYGISLDGCGMEIDNTCHKEHDGRYEGNVAAPPRGHTRGKWVPGLASEGMRKSGNSVEYFCRPCNKNIRNRRSYETHISTLCHLKKLMSSSSNGASSVTSEGPRLRSRRLQLGKSNVTSEESNLNRCSVSKDESEFFSTCDPNSQNYLMESLGIKRKITVSESQDNDCSGAKAGRTIGRLSSNGLSSNNRPRSESSTVENFGKKKRPKMRRKKKVKRRKIMCKGKKEFAQSSNSITDERNKKSTMIRRSSSSEVPFSISGGVSDTKIPKKSLGNRNSNNGSREKIRGGKSVCVEEKINALSEEKFLPISDPHISHGYCYDSLEIQEKQKKFKENIDMVKQRCDSSVPTSSDNLQDQMMLGLELMRTEHLSSSEKLVNNEKLKPELLPKYKNADSGEDVVAKGVSGSYVEGQVLSFQDSKENYKGVIEGEQQKVSESNFVQQLENVVSGATCSSSVNREVSFKNDKVAFTSPNHDGRNSYKNEEISNVRPAVIKDKSPMQSEECLSSVLNANSQADGLIETMKGPNEMVKESNLPKCVGSQDVSNLLNVLCDDSLVLGRPKKLQNYFTLKVVRKGEHIIDLCKSISHDQIGSLIDITCGDNNSKVESDNRKIVQCRQPKNVDVIGNDAALTESTHQVNRQFSCSIKNLPKLVKSGSKILVVKRKTNQVHQPLMKEVLFQKGQILILNESGSSLHHKVFKSDSEKHIKTLLNTLENDATNIFLDSISSKQLGDESVKNGNIKDGKLQLGLPQALCKVTKSGSKIVTTELQDVTVEKGDLNSELGVVLHDNYTSGGGLTFLDNPNCSPSNSKLLNEGSVTRNLLRGIGTNNLNENVDETLDVEGNIGDNVTKLDCKTDEVNDRGTAKKEFSYGHGQVCTVDFDKDHSSNYLMASLSPVECEEVVGFSEASNVPCPTINIVIGVDCTTRIFDDKNVCDNSATNNGSSSDVFSNKISNTNPLQDLFYPQVPQKPSPSTKFIEERKISSEYNSQKEVVLETKVVKSEKGEQVVFHRNVCVSNGLGKTCVSNTSGSAMVSTMNEGGSSSQQEAGKAVWYSCKLCGYKSSRHWCVERHMKKHFPRDRSYSCNRCSFSFLTLDNLKQHMKRHKKKRWCCSFQSCNQAFSTKQELLVHMSGPHVAEKSHKCHLCDYSGKNIQALMRHKKVHEEQGSSLQCEICSQICKRGCLSRHMKMHGKHTQYHCPYCDFTSYYLTSIHRHVVQSETHLGKKLYNCPFCPLIEDPHEKNEEPEHSYCIARNPFSTNIVHEMMDHINSVHKEEKNYSYLYSSVSEIISKIHKLLGIVGSTDL